METPGKKIGAICDRCNGVVEAVSGIHDVPFSDGIGVARGILAFSCCECGRVCAIPATSTHAIKAARKAARSALSRE